MPTLTRYEYKVSASVTFTGRELRTLVDCCGAHYDAGIRRLFNKGYFGFAWLNEFAWRVEPDPNPDDPGFSNLEWRVKTLEKHADTTVDLWVDTLKLNRLMKATSLGGSPEVLALHKALSDLFDNLKRHSIAMNT